MKKMLTNFWNLNELFPKPYKKAFIWIWKNRYFNFTFQKLLNCKLSVFYFKKSKIKFDYCFYYYFQLETSFWTSPRVIKEQYINLIFINQFNFLNIQQLIKRKSLKDVERTNRIEGIFCRIRIRLEPRHLLENWLG